MIYGVFSDIHGNLEALEAVMADMAARGIERYWCLGDIVGYGADPNECIRRVRGVAEHTVMGNHDSAAIGREDTTHFNRYAREACEWTAGRLEPENREWLKGLPLTVMAGDIMLVHASPFEPKSWPYMFYVSDMLNGFNALQGRAAFIGHSHQPVVLVNRGGEYFSFAGEEFRLEPGTRCIVNVGSVGQPRDNNPEASYAVWDSDTSTVRIRRVAYDTETAMRKIREAGLPDILAQRLEFGN